MKKFFCLLVWILFNTPVFSQDYEFKTALVIGNTNYEVGKLRNPVNDARKLSETLTGLGFDVIARYDMDRIGLREAIREFGDAIRDKDGLALFYYSGHGLQSEGTNYLVPVDADIKEEWEIRDQCVSSDQILRMLNSFENPFNIIILDACRNNPYESRYRSATKGLAQPEIVPTGSIMAFSTSPGKVASDGDGSNGLYTQELIKAIQTPGLDIEDVFKQTRINVKAISGDEQIPWETSSLVGDFYFIDDGSESQIQTAVIATPIAATTEPEDFKGEYFEDPRDNRRYKIVTIGEQTWFAESLKYATPNSRINDTGDRFYTWKEANDVCPEGWHLMKTRDAMQVAKPHGKWKTGGKSFKSKYGWDNGGAGTNETGLNLKPLGVFDTSGMHIKEGFEGPIWTSHNAYKGMAYYLVIKYDSDQVREDLANRDVKMPVRCVLDEN